MAGGNRSLHSLVALGLAAGLSSSADVVAQTGGSDALALASLVDTDGSVRSRAIARLSIQRGDPVAIEALSAAAVLDLVPDLRAEALMGLSQIADARVMPVFSQAVLDPAPRVRRVAVTVVWELGGNPADVLATGLTDPDADVREAAVYALGRAHPPASEVMLETALVDPHPAVCLAATLVLSELHRREAGISSASERSALPEPETLPQGMRQLQRPPTYTPR